MRFFSVNSFKPLAGALCSALLFAPASAPCSAPIAVLLAAPGASQTRYVVTDLGDFEPTGISQSGAVIGTDGTHGYVWDRAHGLTEIPGFYPDEYNDCRPNGISDYQGGTVVGIESNAQCGFVWDRVRGTRRLLSPTALFGLSDFDRPYAYGINEAGDVVGNYRLLGEDHAFLDKPGRGWRGYPIPDVVSGGFGVNMSDQVLCGVWYENDPGVAIWEPDGTVVYLGNMPNYYENEVGFINDRGYVSGTEFGGYAQLAYLWDPAGGYVPIYNSIDPSYSTVAGGINNHNAVVGQAADGTGPVGFVWTPEAGMTILEDALIPGSPAWDVTDADGINDSGQIAAYATMNGEYHALLLTPVTGHP